MTSRTRRAELAVLAVLALLAAAVLSGCKDPYGTAAKAANDTAIAIASAENAVAALQQGNTITATEAKNILGYLNAANSLDLQFTTCIGTLHLNKFAVGYLACAQAFLNGLRDPNELANLRVSNPASQQKVDLIVNAITVIVQGVVTALQSSSAGGQ